MTVVTAGAPPAVAASVFGPRLDLACRYADWLVGAGVERGLVGPREPGRLWHRHLVNCAAIAALIKPGALVIDVGSGAGLPGLALAIARPDVRVILVDSMLRRAEFLREVAGDIGLASVSVRRARVEDLGPERLRADVVTARAVAPMAKLAGWAAPVLGAGGALLAMKGASANDDVAAGWPTLRRAGLRSVRVVEVGPARSGGAPGFGESMLPGTSIATVGRWSSDGVFAAVSRSGHAAPAASGAVATDPVDTPFAVVVEARREAQGLSESPTVGLG